MLAYCSLNRSGKLLLSWCSRSEHADKTTALHVSLQAVWVEKSRIVRRLLPGEFFSACSMCANTSIERRPPAALERALTRLFPARRR